MTSSLRVLVVGAGLGGLCLAQGLQRAGIFVNVYERDAVPEARRQGYRIHIDTRGATGLRACLPPHLYELFCATASPPGHQLTVVNKHLKKLKIIGSSEQDAAPPARFNAGVNRLTLREILLIDLNESVHFNKEFTHYEQLAGGSVRAHFADGTQASGDVLVAADGVNSRIRQQFLPEAAVVDTGVRCIYGKTLLTEATRPFVPDCLYNGFTAAVGFHFTLALGLVRFSQPPAEAAARLAPGAQLHATNDYLMWSLNARRAHMHASDDELFRMDGSSLRQFVMGKIKRWHPNLRALIAASEPDEAFPIAARVATSCDPWQSTSVTLLGDAIHAMSPAGGSGANMALLDAYRLCQALTSVTRGETALLPAMHEYEARMLKEGFDAVHFSAQGGVLQT